MLKIIFVCFVTWTNIQCDPCSNYQNLDTENDFIRSVSNSLGLGLLCDNFLTASWYRITSKAGERMPTSCIANGGRCGTSLSIWMNGEYPSIGEIKNITACASSYSGDCCAYSYGIQVKNCTNYLVYNLQPVAPCPQAYCFGAELPCPLGETSDNGFSPGCTFDPCHSSNYKILSGEIKRSSNYTLQTDGNAIDDSRLTPGWYRINSSTGNDIVNQSVSMMQCGTVYPLWMKGNIPQVADKTVGRKVCRSALTSSCEVEYNIQVRNCGNYRTYYLEQLQTLQSAYCFGTLPVQKMTATTTNQQDYIDSKNETKIYVWVIVAILIILIVALIVTFVIIHIYKTRVSKRAVSCVSLGKLPSSYDHLIKKPYPELDVKPVVAFAVQPNSTMIAQMKCKE